MEKICNGKSLLIQIVVFNILFSLNIHAQNNWVTLPDGKQIVANKNTPLIYTYSKENGKLDSLHIEDPQEVIKVIVTLKDSPLAVYMKKNALQKTSLTSVKSTLQTIHSSVMSQINNIAQQLSVGTDFQYQYKLRYEYYTAINGMALECNRGMVDYIRSLPDVESVQPDVQVKANLTQSVHQIRADIVQDSLGYDGDGVVIGEIDTGIDYKNPALGGGFGPEYRVIGGHDFINNDDDPMDDNGHGTHVAGIIGADGGKDLTGVAPKVKFLALKVLNQNGIGEFSDIIGGVEYCMDPDYNPTTDDEVDIINMSFGALPIGNFSTALDDAVNNATQAGILSVVAAGNNGVPNGSIPWFGQYRTISSPGTVVSALTVGACDDAYSIADFSSRGPDGIHYAIKPEVVAPGVGILSTILNNQTATWSGTSMATPHVTGVAALLKQQHPDWSPGQLKSVIVNSAKSWVNASLPYVQGNGCVDALNAATLGVSVQPGVFSFGIVDVTVDIWKDTVEFTVRNLRNTSQNINLEIQSGLPSAIELDLSQTSFNLSPKQEIQIAATITVPKSVPIVYKYPYGYTGNIICSSDSDRIQIPFAVIKTNVLTVETDIQALSLVLLNQNKQTLFLEFAAPGLNNKYTVPVDSGKYHLYAYLWAPYNNKSTNYNIFREVNTTETNHIILNHNEAVFSAFNGLDPAYDTNDNPVKNIGDSELYVVISYPRFSMNYIGSTLNNSQILFGPADSSATVIQSICSVQGNDVLLLNKMSSGIKDQSDLTFLTGSKNLGELNVKLDYTYSSTMRAFFESKATECSATYDDWWNCIEIGYLLPNLKDIHFMTNKNTGAFNPMNYFSNVAGFGIFNDLNNLLHGGPKWQLTSSDFILNENNDFVFFERKPFRPNSTEYVQIQTLKSGDSLTVENDAYNKNVQIPKFQFMNQYAGSKNLSLSQFNTDYYDDGGVMCPDGTHAQVEDDSPGSQFNPQMFANNTLLPIAGTNDPAVYYDYKLNDKTARYNLTAESYAYSLLGQHGLTTIDYEFSIKPDVFQYYFLPSLDLFQILADGKITQWLRPDQHGKVRLAIFDPKQNVDSVGISLLKNDGTEINLTTTHPSAKEYLAPIPQDIPGGFLDVIAKVHNTEGNIFTLTVSPAFYDGASIDSVQYNAMLRLKTYSLDNANSVQFNPGDTLKYTLTFSDYGYGKSKDISIRFPQTDYFVPVGDSTVTLDSIWQTRQKNYGEIPLTLVFLGKKQPNDTRSYYTPSISWNSNGRLFSRKYSISINFSSTPTNIELGNAVPKEYFLSQNFPNPFNPSTKINYSVPQNSYVTIKVYDVLGKEVAILVNEEKPAGNYEVKFDGSKLSTGVYFYRMQSGTFTEVKKLILIK